MNTASLDDALTDDHVQLDGLFRRVRTAVGLRDPAAESARSEFERRLMRHMSWEEEVLFPSLRAAQARYPEKKIESLVIDHARIREKLQELAEAIRGREWSAATPTVDDLWVLLEGHNRDEEKGVYTDADRLISEDERRRLVNSWITSSPR
ncbi:MAG: hemerythrin domain-containing protein [Planctomycetota bacterium]|nr:MAG: hemerythrin domain-containing protein [Planctomycetota bacterium]